MVAEVVVLLVPIIVGMKIAPCVSASAEMRSYLWGLVDHSGWRVATYALLSSPVPGHKITIVMLAVLELAVWDIINAIH